MIEDDVRTRLAADANIAGLVDTRIYPSSAMQGAVLPRITYTRISTQRSYTMTAQVSLTKTRLQYDCWAKTYLTADLLADYVRLSLTAFKGTLGAYTVYGCFIDAELDGPDEEPVHATDVEVYRRILDLTIAHSE